MCANDVDLYFAVREYYRFTKRRHYMEFDASVIIKCVCRAKITHSSLFGCIHHCLSLFGLWKKKWLTATSSDLQKYTR